MATMAVLITKRMVIEASPDDRDGDQSKLHLCFSGFPDIYVGATLCRHTLFLTGHWNSGRPDITSSEESQTRSHNDARARPDTGRRGGALRHQAEKSAASRVKRNRHQMAKPSKQRPWAVEMSVAAVEGQWFAMDAYRDEETAEMNAKLMRKRAPDATFRVRKVESRS